MNEYNYKLIEKKWQTIWLNNRCFEANPINNKKKYFLTIPFPYLNGNLHVGHVRTFTIGDTIARYKRMTNFNVLFPMGFHVTGTPIVGLSDLIKNEDKLTLDIYFKYHNIKLNILKSLNTPEKIVEYFKAESEIDMKNIGYSIDWRRKFTTTSPGFKKFVEWQYNTLYKLNLLIKGSHPVKWCPYDKNPIGDHDILHGEEATIIEYILIKFRYKNIIFPCATLRPETTYGVTNLWINKNIKYCKIQVTSKDNLCEVWIVSKTCYEKLKYIEKDVLFLKDISSEELFGISIKNPTTDGTIFILPSTFVEEDIGTGIVMSVPSHSPYDYLSLKDLVEEINVNNKIYPKIDKELISKINPIPVIKVNANNDNKTVEDVISFFNLKTQSDKYVKEATKILYKKEYNYGILLPISGKYKNNFVHDIKDQIVHDLINQGIATKFYVLSEPVICRCGTSCVINIVQDQWFLNYSNKDWKKKVRDCLSNMKLIPEDIRTEFQNKITWLKDKACARKRGLGTMLPQDPKWIIESLGDSTIYMVYYIISKYIYEQKIFELHLTKDFFDFILLDIGNIENLSMELNIEKSIIFEIKNEFKYWYPIDLRSSGKDLVPNHLLFYLFHHVALFKEKYWPQKIAVNGFVSLEGQKMSKSKGPLLTLKNALITYGADTTRFYILTTSEQTQDLDWKNEGIETSKKQLEKWYSYLIAEKNRFIKESINSKKENIFFWIESRLQKYIFEANNSLENLKTRNTIQNIYYLLNNDIRWYYKRNGTSSLKSIMETWIKLLYPFIPHMCEELWHNYGHSDYLFNEQYPQYNKSKINIELELFENLIQNIIKDIEEIKNIVHIIKPKEIYIIMSPEWKYEIIKIILEEINKTNNFDDNIIDPKTILKIALTNYSIQKYSKEAYKFIFKLLVIIKPLNYEGKISTLKCYINEIINLPKEKDYFKKTFKCNVFIITSYDIKSIKYLEKINNEIILKITNSNPGKPAIYII